jgi:hypothetical protein
VLAYLEATLGLHPSALLNQTVGRYESGELKHVPRQVMERAAALKASAEKALSGGARKDPAKIREMLLGGKPGATRYDDVKDELYFLKHHAGKGIRGYLGRSPWSYEKGSARCIATWRARRILADCTRFIQENPDLPLACLPPSYRGMLARRVTAVLKARAARLLSTDQGLALERQIVKPRRARDDYIRRSQDFIPFERAPGALNMRPSAFDLMVARHSGIFRSIGKFEKRWYLPGAYLKELVMQRGFGLIVAKYEAEARQRAESSKTRP